MTVDTATVIYIVAGIWGFAVLCYCFRGRLERCVNNCDCWSDPPADYTSAVAAGVPATTAAIQFNGVQGFYAMYGRMPMYQEMLKAYLGANPEQRVMLLPYLSQYGIQP